MNVVRGGVAVNDLNGLAGHHADYVGFIFAAALRQGDRIFRNVEGAVAESLFYVDENVLEVPSAHYDVLGSVRALAVGVLAHVNFCWLGRGTIEFYGSDYDCGGGGVNRRGGWGCGRARSCRLLLGGFLLAASGEQNDPEQSR